MMPVALGCLKHFQVAVTNVDSHLGLPILEENLEQVRNELVPFIKGIEHHVDSI
jgi:beta-glucosidase-like glycosyl hydrolase